MEPFFILAIYLFLYQLCLLMFQFTYELDLIIIANINPIRVTFKPYSDQKYRNNTKLGDVFKDILI